MRLDTKALRYLTAEDWRVLTAVEQGSKNHEIVPTPLIAQLSGLRGGNGHFRCISTLAKANLIARVKNAKYDGYRLTYGGLDYLSLHAHTKKQTLYSVGNQIGIGKESDIFVVASPTGKQLVLKIHRLGRISFRTVKANRDYLRNRSSGSWMYMSRLAALKEFTFMTALKENGFEVPTPIAQNRHTIVMELIDAFPLRQIREVPDPAGLYAELMEMILKLASFGLIHGDFNEFNILIKETQQDTHEPDIEQKQRQETSLPQIEPDPSAAPETNPNMDSSIQGQGTSAPQEPEANLESSSPSSNTSSIKATPILIDFPQMISVSHPNASMYFDRDVKCIKDFFYRKFGFTSDAPGPFFKDAMARVKKGSKRLDIEAEASGFSKKMAKELESYMKEVGVDGDRGERSPDTSDEDAFDEDEADEIEEGIEALEIKETTS